MRINHNIPALRTLNQLARTNSKMDKTMQRLSSGLRINSAADDAAGLAIAQKMDTQVRGLKQANRNAMDGISLIQTAEGALNEVHAMLQRVRELAIQSSNGTLTAEDRKAINDEVDQLKQEIKRISDNIEFNERKLLNGEIDRRAFSNNKKVADIVSMSDTVDPGSYTFTVGKAATQTYVDSIAKFDVPTGVSGKININGEQVEILATDDAQTAFAKLRDLCDTVGIDLFKYESGSDEKLSMVVREYGAVDLTIKGDKDLLVKLGLQEANANSTPVAATEGNNVEISGISGSFPPNTTYTIEGNRIVFQASEGFQLIAEGSINILDPEDLETPKEAGPTGEVTLDILETGPLDLQIGANEGQFMQVRIQNLSPTSLGLDNMNLNTTESSQRTITIVDDAIEQISSVRSKLGAYQNRLEHTVANLDVAAENMTSSLSRIQDADMAAEMAEYTQKNILSQAGTSMLAQANQRPAQILQLLQG